MPDPSTPKKLCNNHAKCMTLTAPLPSAEDDATLKDRRSLWYKKPILFETKNESTVAIFVCFVSPCGDLVMQQG
jgi:hypothetical protein